MTFEVHPATGARWDDVCSVMTTTGDSGRCWCQWFRTGTRQWQEHSGTEHRDALRAQVDADRAPGVVGYLDGEPVAWSALAPRSDYLRLQRSRKLVAAGVADDLDDETVWAVTCFVVRAPFRRRGLTVPLLAGAVGFARDRGARVVEAYPVDVSRREGIGFAELFAGTLSTFLAASFLEVGRSAPARPVVRRRL